MDGMNEYGVAVSVLLIENNSTHIMNPDLVDITTTIIIRGILDTCINVEEAIKFLINLIIMMR
jgi:predicted choloylglycine hydrolase